MAVLKKVSIAYLFACGGDCHSNLMKGNDMPTLNGSFGFFRSAFDAFVAAREREAAAYVNGALLMLDDETLTSNGYNRRDLQRRPSKHAGL